MGVRKEVMMGTYDGRLRVLWMVNIGWYVVRS